MLDAAFGKVGSQPEFAAHGTKVRCRETALTLQTPLSAHSRRMDLRPDNRGASEADWETCVRCRTLGCPHQSTGFVDNSSSFPQSDMFHQSSTKRTNIQGCDRNTQRQHPEAKNRQEAQHTTSYEQQSQHKSQSRWHGTLGPFDCTL